MTHIEALIGTGKKQTTIDRVPIEMAAAYACADADMTLRLVDELKPQLERDGIRKLFSEVEMPLVPVIAAMELCGIAVDVPNLKTISTSLYEKLQILEKEIHDEAGYNFNINSPDQLGEVLFGKLGLPGGKKTSTRKFSTTKEMLEGLREYPIVEKVLTFRQLGKLKSTYVDSLPLLVNPQTGRLHTSFHQIGASTGRISSSDPNLQNIPIRTEVGSEIRRAFIADNNSPHHLFDEPSVLLAADYSQIELRMLAHLTHDPRLVDAFQHDKDIHAATASDIFGLPEGQIDAGNAPPGEDGQLRHYLRSERHRSEPAYWLFRSKRPSDFIKEYNERYPAIKAYLDQTPTRPARPAMSRPFWAAAAIWANFDNSNVSIRQAAERQAINMPVQGTAADIVKIAMIRVSNEMREKELKSPNSCLQVHDELVFEAPKSELAVLAELVKRNMEGVGPAFGAAQGRPQSGPRTGATWKATLSNCGDKLAYF